MGSCHLNLVFKNLELTVKDNLTGTPKRILQGVHGECRVSRLLAVMGPSGSGKTTLLDVLAGNVMDGCRMEGSITVNGVDAAKSDFQRHSCYVQQKDVLLSSATVREAVTTSALLKLPRTVSYAEKRSRVEAVLQELDLLGCADTLVGDETIGLKGISGGQKRRVSVGIELVKDPAVMFLDEPTSGLDSEMAGQVIATLRALARRQRTIVCTIHQPNSDITDCFDDFLLLAAGRAVYAGPWAGAVSAFASQGFQCPAYKNPTDYFMSVIRSPEAVDLMACANDKGVWGRGSKAGALGGAVLQAAQLGLHLDAAEESSVSTSEGTASSSTSAAFFPAAASAGRASHPGGTGSVAITMDGVHNAGPRDTTPYDACHTSTSQQQGAAMWQQVAVLVQRNWRTWMRSPIMLVSELVQYVFIGVFVGLMYYTSFTNQLPNGAFDRLSCIWFFFAVLSFTPSFTAVTAWDRERLLLHRELGQKQYSLLSHQLSRSAVMYPLEALQCAIFLLIVYWFVGFQSGLAGFFFIYLALFMFQIISEGLGLICAIVTRTATFAVILLTFVMLLILSFSGFLVSKVPVYFKWVHTVSYLTYAYAAVARQEFEGLTFVAPDGGLVPGMAALPPGLSNTMSVGANLAILAGITATVEVLKYLAMLLAYRLNVL